MSYPSDELVTDWRQEYLRVSDGPSFKGLAKFMARKACDWQKERDAEICRKLDGAHDDLYAQAIREQA